MGKNDLRRTKAELIRELDGLRRRLTAAEKRAARADDRHEAQVRFHALIQNSSDIIAVLRADGAIAFMSPSSKRMLGYAAEEMIGQPAFGYVHPDDRALVGDSLQDVLNYRNDNLPTQFRVRHADGRYVLVESLGANLIGFPGIEGVVLNIRDVGDRQRVEEALRESEERWKFALEGSNQGLWDWDIAANTFFYSPRWKEMLGYDAGEIGDSPEAWSQRVHPDDRPGSDRALQEHIAGRARFYENEHRLRCKDGSWKWILDRGMIVSRDAAGRPLRMIGTHTDISERKQAEAALQESEAKHRRLFETMPQGVVYQDGNGRIVSANPAAERILGLTLAQMQGRTSFDPRWRAIREDGSPFPGDEHPAVVALGSGQPVHDVVMGVFHAADNATRWIRVNAVPLFRANETRPYQVYATFDDITEPRRTEEAIRKSEQTFRAFIEQSSDGLLLVDSDGRIIEWNDAQARITAIPREQALGRDLLDVQLRLIPPERRSPEYTAQLDQAIRRARQTGESPFLGSSGEIDIHRADGVVVSIQQVIFPIRTARGFILGAISRDITARKRAERTLQAERQQLGDIIEFLPDATFVIDREKRVIAWNRAAEAMTGVSKQEMLGRTDYAYAVPFFGEKRPILVDLLDQPDGQTERTYKFVRREGANIYGESFIPNLRGGDGAHLWGVAAPLYDRDGNRSGAIEVIRDITANRQAEERLKQSEEMFRTIFHASPIGIEFYGADGRLLTANQASMKIFGLGDESEVSGFNLFAGTSLNDELKEKLRAGAAVSYHAAFDFDKVRALGQYSSQRTGRAELDYQITPLAGADRQTVSGYLLQVQDVTERRRAEQALHDSESRFASFMEHSPSLVLIKDEELRPVFASRLYRELFPVDEWLGRTPEECFPPEVASDMRRRDSEALVLGHTQYEEQWRDNEGRLRHFSTQKFRIDRPGQAPLLGVVITDISERRQAEEERLKLERQVLQAQKLESLGVLAGGIAHDFNNLLTAILGNLDLARMNLSALSPAWRNLEQAQASTLRAADLARQMLAYSGKGRFVVEAIDLNELVEEMAHMLQVSISKKALLHFHLAAELPAVEADATQMRQVIMNLVINASDAIGDQTGVISLATGRMHCDADWLRSFWMDEQQPAGDYVFIEVTDTGSGMDNETQARMFDPFFSTKFTGRGLGLAAVLGIVRGHRGAIKVESEVGRGSTFRVLLPASDRGISPAGGPPDRTADWRGSGTVLLVDDEPGILEVGSEMLQRMGFDVHTAGDGRQAIDAFNREPGRIRCVILDLTMPSMDGEEAFHELRRQHPGVRVILSSGYNEQEVTQRFVGRGLDGFIQKPYQFANLRRKLMEVLAD